MVEEVKKLLTGLIENTAKKHSVESTDIRLCFLLVNSSEFKCKYRNEEVLIEDSGFLEKFNFMERPFAKNKIKKFILEFILRVANESGVPKQNANIIMHLDAGKELEITLRNKDLVVRKLNINDILNK